MNANFLLLFILSTQNNQYPPSFYEPFITKALGKCCNRVKEDNDSEENLNEEEKPKHMVQIQYRGKCRMIPLGIAPSRFTMHGSFHSSKI